MSMEGAFTPPTAAVPLAETSTPGRPVLRW